eukprot:TRINITY_DN34570_c0_g1_i1.p1 TRINITY_DN34570_c0_g1~~TRINITY_DN34570_c0_g1_i1.p1  ORF type:complete len:373 (+),score=89.25 TRINITY_DN34570_c0_g1_i1:112-1230(+)
MAKDPRVLVIGAGITGAATTALLTSSFSGVAVTVWEQALVVGGRMASTHADCDPRMHADLGAQYISAGAGGGNHSQLLAYDRLVQRSLLAPFKDTIIGARGPKDQGHFVAPAGLGSICQALLSSARTDLGRQVTSLEHQASPVPAWRATCADGVEDVFDAVVLSVPAPAALQIGGHLSSLLASTALSQVQYSSRWAAALYYPPEAWGVLEQLPWAAKYVSKEEDDALVFISFESRKRGASSEAGGPGPVLVAHTSVPWGLRHMQDDADTVAAVLIERVHALIEQETGMTLTDTIETKPIMWRESQVRPGTELGGGAVGAVLLGSAGAPVVLAGDAVAGSNFENCVRSASEAAELVGSALNLVRLDVENASSL